MITTDSVADFHVSEEIAKTEEALGTKVMLAWHSTPVGYGQLTMPYLSKYMLAQIHFHLINITKRMAAQQGQIMIIFANYLLTAGPDVELNDLTDIPACGLVIGVIEGYTNAEVIDNMYSE